jgi:hypothetical protein
MDKPDEVDDAEWDRQKNALYTRVQEVRIKDIDYERIVDTRTTVNPKDAIQKTQTQSPKRQKTYATSDHQTDVSPKAIVVNQTLHWKSLTQEARSLLNGIPATITAYDAIDGREYHDHLPLGFQRNTFFATYFH